MTILETKKIIKKLAINYQHTEKDIFKIMQDRGFKIDAQTLDEQITYFRLCAIRESLEEDIKEGLWTILKNLEGDPKKSELIGISKKSINFATNYFKKYPNCWQTKALQNLFNYNSKE